MNIVTTLTVVRSQIEAVAKVTNRSRKNPWRAQSGRRVRTLMGGNIDWCGRYRMTQRVRFSTLLIQNKLIVTVALPEIEK
jgi:hypothetical protein